MGLGNLLMIPGLGVVVPSVTSQPASIEVYEGQTATFTVAATGGGLSYQWQKSDNAGVDWSNISGATATSYTTPATVRTTDNNDQFRCVITNSAGTVNSNAATLTVWNPLALGADLACWLDPSSGIFTERTGASATTASANGDPIGTWRARNGTINGTAAADAQRAIYRATGLNGTPGVEFDGTDDRFDFTANLAATFQNKGFGYVFMGVASEAEPSPSCAMAFQTPSGITRAGLFFNNLSTSGRLLTGGRRLDSDTAIAVSVDSAFTSLEVFVAGCEFLWGVSDLHLRKNGLRIASNSSFFTDGNTSNTASGGVALGCFNLTSGTEFFDGPIGHVIVTCPTSAHSSETMRKIEGFIAYKQGTTLA